MNYLPVFNQTKKEKVINKIYMYQVLVHRVINELFTTYQANPAKKQRTLLSLWYQYYYFLSSRKKRLLTGEKNIL